MKKVFKPIRFSITPLVGVIALLAVLAAYWAVVSYIHRDMHDCLGRVIAVVFLSFCAFISSGDYRGAPILELDDASLKVGDDVLLWKDVAAIELVINGMTPILSIKSAKEKFFIPIDGYHARFSLMRDIAACCRHLSWHPPHRGAYFLSKYIAIVSGVGLILALMMFVAGGIWLAQWAGIGWVGVIGGMVFACGTVMLLSGFWLEKNNTFLRLWTDWLSIALGATFMIGAIGYAHSNNNTALVGTMTAGGLLISGVALYRKIKWKKKQRGHVKKC